jgi:hypothetical protein
LEYKKNIYWLASYPKSGNTWFRIFLANYLNKSNEPISINEIGTGSIASSRVMFDDVSAIASSELLQDEIDMLRADIYREFSKELKENSYNKVHDSYILVNGKPMFPKEISAGVIYFVRNPLDVVLSYANHSSIDIDKSIKLINSSKHKLAKSKKGLNNQLQQQLGSWSQHVKSWTEQKEIPVLIMRYEDMLDDTYNVFKKALEFLKLDFDETKFAKAIENSSFNVLTKLEEKDGFKEKPLKTEKFFNTGKSGNWKEVLNKEQINLIVENNREQMLKFNYL